MKVNNDLKNHWKDLLKPIFPDGSEIEVYSNASNVVFSASWRIGTDPKRPNKLSKTILVKVPNEVANDYSDKNDAQRKSDDMKLKEFVRSKLSNKNFDHNKQSYELPPEVTWVAGSNVLNS